MSKKLLLLVFYISFFAPCVLTQNNGQNVSGPCDKVYKTAIRFVVDTPTAHYFSVNPTGGKVIFSRGNLQYCPGKDEWRFALRQFDRCGDGKQAVTPSGLNQTPGYGNTTVFYDSIDYSTKDPTTKSGFREISGIPCNNLLNSKHYNGWIDLFPWATSGHGGKVKDTYACFFYPYEWNYSTINATYNEYGYGPSFD
ncbi:MAG: hypothetical protein II502_00910, partial [Paludibacteraceae bacterium]|nr:hypothetical protein [Paludibacteraceae bacterium]